MRKMEPLLVNKKCHGSEEVDSEYESLSSEDIDVEIEFFSSDHVKVLNDILSQLIRPDLEVLHVTESRLRDISFFIEGHVDAKKQILNERQLLHFLGHFFTENVLEKVRWNLNVVRESILTIQYSYRGTLGSYAVRLLADLWIELQENVTRTVSEKPCAASGLDERSAAQGKDQIYSSEGASVGGQAGSRGGPKESGAGRGGSGGGSEGSARSLGGHGNQIYSSGGAFGGRQAGSGGGPRGSGAGREGSGGDSEGFARGLGEHGRGSAGSGGGSEGSAGGLGGHGGGSGGSAGGQGRTGSGNILLPNPVNKFSSLSPFLIRVPDFLSPEKRGLSKLDFNSKLEKFSENLQSHPRLRKYGMSKNKRYNPSDSSDKDIVIFHGTRGLNLQRFQQLGIFPLNVNTEFSLAPAFYTSNSIRQAYEHVFHAHPGNSWVGGDGNLYHPNPVMIFVFSVNNLVLHGKKPPADGESHFLVRWFPACTPGEKLEWQQFCEKNALGEVVDIVEYDIIIGPICLPWISNNDSGMTMLYVEGYRCEQVAFRRRQGNEVVARLFEGDRAGRL